MSDSVGRIQLDLEINPNSIMREMGSVQEAFKDGMKKPFTDMGNFFKNSMARMAESFRSMVPGEAKEAPAEMSEQIESLATQMDNASNQAEMYRQRLKDLTEQYEMMDVHSRRVGFGEKLYEDMLKAEDRMLRFGARSDKLRLEIEKLEAATAQAGQTTEKAGRQIVKAGDHAKKAQSKIGGFGNSIQRVFARVLRQIFVFAVLYKTIRGFMDYLGSALKTNQEFSHSLAQVKTNLQVAFMPIYQAILPALQALMRWLAVATTYIAAFTSAIFGKTYKASFGAAKGLNAAKGAMDGYGKAAKKTLGALAGFDEIHVLGSPAEDTGGGAGTAGPELVAPPIDVGLVEESMARVKEFFATIFQPFRAAWESEGANVIASAKYALSGVCALVKAIGKSFAEVWTGGTGQAILETFLRILQTIFGLIGDIGHTFANVWAEGGRGTAIVQGVADIFLHLLGLVERIGESLQTVWGVVGETVARTFLDIIGATIGVLEHLGETLLWVWDHGGEHLFQGLIRLGAKVFELAGYIYTEFVAPFIEWFIDLIAPAIAEVLDWAGWLLDKFVDLIDWLLGDGKPVLDTIVTVLGSMALAFGLVKIAIGAYNAILVISKGIMIAVNLVTRIMQVGLLATLGPFNVVVIAIGALIAIGVLLYKNWDTISAKAKTIFGNLKNFIKGICDSVSGFFKGMVNGVIRALNSMIGGLNKLKFDVPSWVPLLGGKKFGFNIPRIPLLARGGIIDQPTLAMIGERRKKEAVLPLEQNTGWMDTLAAKIAAVISGQSGGEEGPWIIQVNVGSSKVLEEIIEAARRKNAKAGRTVVQVGV